MIFLSMWACTPDFVNFYPCMAIHDHSKRQFKHEQWESIVFNQTVILHPDKSWDNNSNSKHEDMGVKKLAENEPSADLGLGSF